MRRADWLSDVLTAAGVTVKTYPGWHGRGRDFTDLRAVVWHHDASPSGDSPGVPAYMLRQMAAGKAAAQLWVDRRGTWHVLAAGVAFHTGNVRAGMPGNDESLGVETDHTTGEDWPVMQVTSLRAGTAAILRRLGQDSSALHMHKTIASPPGRKTDPDGLDLHPERGRLAVLMADKPTPTSEEDPVASFLFNSGGKTYWRDGGDTIHVPTMDDVNKLLSAGVRNVGELSAEFGTRLVEAGKQ